MTLTRNRDNIRKFQRYAVYYTPPEGALEEFTSSWLGWSSLRGMAYTHVKIPGFDTSKLTQKAQKYGFHATLMAPFRLGIGVSQDSLSLALADFAEANKPARIERLELSDQNGFLALRPKGDVTDLNALAANVTRHFDRFRAPLTAPELVRRRPKELSERQRQNLQKWGYPYVMEDFEFHMTLSGQLPPDVADVLIAELDPLLMQYVPEPAYVDAITLLGEETSGKFHQIHRYALTG